MRYLLVPVLFAFLFSSCSPRIALKKEIVAIGEELNDHTGFLLYDPVKKKNLISFQEDRYFTPASNTKIFTFYTSLKILKDSVAGIKYEIKGDSLIFWGMGDPSFLYENTFDNGRLYNFFEASPNKLYFSPSNFKTEQLGPGWAWDDYPYYYSAERTPMPLYGNLIQINKNSSDLIFTPLRFQSQLSKSTDARGDEKLIRALDSNHFTYFPGKSNRSNWFIPFRYSDSLLVKLLSDTLRREVVLIDKSLNSEAKILKTVPLDSVLRVMMHDSDNFIAEQLLLQCSATLSDTLNSEIAIDFSVKNYLNDLPDKPQWVDGSGLSRYNLFTPRSIVKLWEKIYEEVPQPRLFKLLAVGGKYGTLKNSYKANEPYIYGKTGTLSNNHTLSGYLLTKKGRVLIFSMMNNNYISPTSDVRKRMEKVLFKIHERF
jgi:D-alanyl-D-alanine carboxypeptidase/D-alanyl-D-alanine-endopeptidase (penicillin-binding protein 4)